jgi:hypothetical protein
MISILWKHFKAFTLKLYTASFQYIVLYVHFLCADIATLRK